MRGMFIFACLTLIFSFSCNGVNAPVSNTDPISHQIWDKLLKKHVDERGLVDYKGFKNDQPELRNYLELLANSAPNKETWTREEQLAYWINAYNAFTIELILNNYPVESIKDIASGPLITFVNSPWDIKFIKIGNEKLDLNNIEHGIIRKHFDDSRVHFALVCAARSCPELRNEAYTGERLDKQLEEEAISFINNSSRNKITEGKIKISKYFDWYAGDFEDHGKSIIDYLNQFSKTKISKNAVVEFLDYDWKLNEQR